MSPRPRSGRPYRRFPGAPLAVALLLFWSLAGLCAVGPGLCAAAQGEESASPWDLENDEQALLLRSSVDSVALSLSGVFRTMPGKAARLAAMGTALNSLTFEQGGEVYYTAWNGTRIVHSPLTPDLENTDFAGARDEQGRSFVREMERIAGRGGGFLLVTLPRQRPGNVSKAGLPAARPGNDPLFFKLYGMPLYARPTDGNQKAGYLEDKNAEEGGATAHSFMSASARRVVFSALGGPSGVPQDSSGAGAPPPGAVAYSRPAGGAGASDAARAVEISPEEWAPWNWPRQAQPEPEDDRRMALLDSAPAFAAQPVRQILYVRAIPGSDWHIAALTPWKREGDAPGELSAPGHAAIPAVPALSGDKAGGDRREPEEKMRLGLLISGFALLGLLGVLVFAIRRRRKESP